jgi:hypothetical protein
MELNYFLKRRFGKTLEFMEKHIPKGTKILDLGVPNMLSEYLSENGYIIENTGGEDLDVDFSKVKGSDADVVTSFEIFEHLLAPFNVLREIKASRLVTSVPLHQFFAASYWNKNDERDRHYHEFEKKQFNFLLEKTGWRIIDSYSWSAPVRVIGFRPILRLFVHRYYIVYCEKKPVDDLNQK